MTNLILTPILLPMAGAVACLFLRGSLGAQRTVAGAIATAMVPLALYLLSLVWRDGIQVVRASMWPGGYGIVFALDLLGAVMLCLAAVTFAASWWFVAAGAMPRAQEKALVHPLFLLLGAGVNWAFTTGDLFNLFVSFEIILLSSYVLLAHENGRGQTREGLKFMLLNMIASIFFLASAGLAYGMFGALNMADLAVRIAQAGQPAAATVLGTMLFLTFGAKAAVFPLFFWMPDAYPKAPRGIVAYFSGILTKVGVYCLYRMFPLMFPAAETFAGWFQPLILAVGAGTMLVGVLCALSQMTMKRILSFHIISQIGYMIFALGIFTKLGLAAGIFFIIHQIIVKASMFLVADAVEVNEGSQELSKVGGLVAVYPGLAVIFLFASLSLAGIPPLSGFYGKYALVVEGLVRGHTFYVVVSLVTSILTLMSMMKIWRYAFWRDRIRPANAPVHGNRGVIVATGALVAVSIVVAVFSGPIMRLSTATAEQMIDREQYVFAVLGDRGLAALRAAEEASKP